MIIPILNQDKPIPAAFRSLLEQEGEAEIIVMLGEQARAPTILSAADRARMITSLESTRAALLNQGAAAAMGGVLLFVWPDCRLPADALAAIRHNLTLLPATVGGNFQVQFDEVTGFTRFLAYLLQQLRYRGHYYGNSAIFVRRTTFEAIGGFEQTEILEDYEFGRRMEQYGPTLQLPNTVIAAGQKFRGQKLKVAALWLAMQLLFWLKLRPANLAQIYRRL